jgi:hypothetical protein
MKTLLLEKELSVATDSEVAYSMGRDQILSVATDSAQRDMFTLIVSVATDRRSE